MYTGRAYKEAGCRKEIECILPLTRRKCYTDANEKSIYKSTLTKNGQFPHWFVASNCRSLREETGQTPELGRVVVVGVVHDDDDERAFIYRRRED